MAQKYKVFFNNNRLFIAKKQLSKINFEGIATNPSKSEVKDIITMLLNEESAINYLIITDDLLKTWKNFKSFFEIRKAAGGVVINSKNEKLFIKRHGFWDLPKGHLKKGEKNRVAAVREVMEECGIDEPVIVKKLVKTYHTYTLKKRIVLKPTKWYLMSYSGSNKTKPETKESITEATWANANLEKEMMKNTFLSIKEVAEKGGIIPHS